MKHKLLVTIVLFCSIASTAMAQSIVPEVLYPEEAKDASKVALVDQLPDGSWAQILSGIVQLMLGITGSLALIAFTVGGVMLVTAQGSEERVDKAKKILLWSILALVVIASSYAIILGVSQLEFFQ
ncbi:hypothetical protein KC725_00990 [Candidatus Peregrinibacteria bacterium]|nr:hypothetical protein [Candidatus Peregrinibacteria bacterium]